VGVGAAEPEGTDPGQARARGGRHRGEGRDRVQAQVGEINVRIERFQMEVRRHQALVEHEHGLEQAGQAGNRLQVAEIAFHGPDEQGRAFRAQAGKHLADGPGFHGIAGGGAGAVRLHVAEVADIDVRAS